MEKKYKILYVDMGGFVPYSCDKTAGRVLGWADTENDVTLLVPGFFADAADKATRHISRHPEKIKVCSLPFSRWKTSSSIGITALYFWRVVTSFFVVFKVSKVEIGYSNSPVLVDIIPVLMMRLFGKCQHWILMLDSIVPSPGKRTGSRIINTVTYLEAQLVFFLAKHFATIVFTVNPELQKEIATFGIAADKILLSKNGLFMDRIKKVTVPETEKIYDAVFMGRITENKGIFDLAAVWSEIVAKNSKVKLAVMGTGRANVVEKFKRTIKGLGIEKNVDYLGYTIGDKKYEILKKSKIFIFLSKVNADESWGISLMEALACGLPAITYDLAIYSHVYAPGILQKSAVGDTKDIVDKTEAFLYNEKKRKALSISSSKFAEQFDWFEIASNDLDSINKKLVAGS